MTEARFYDSEGVLHQVSTLDSRVITFVVDDAVKLIHIIALE